MLALRQSCDRCHEHKVRCIREMPEKTVPCARCTRAGTSCIYSIQQKPGRRMSSKDSTSTRKRTATRTSVNPLDLISDESKSDAPVPAEEWLHSLDALTEPLSPSPNEPITALTTATAEEAPSYFCMIPFETPAVDRMQTHIEQLAALVATVGRSVSTLFGSASRLSLSTSSAPFNDICASTGALIMIISQLCQPDAPEAGGLVDVNMRDLDSHLNPLPAFDYLPAAGSASADDMSLGGPAALLSPVTLMMILACYQRLLEAFEIICLFMQQRLQELEMCSFMGPLSPPLSSPHTGAMTPPSETLQFIMMIKLTSDLLNRLDRAMTSLVGDAHRNPGGGPLGLPGVGRRHLSPDLSSSSSSTSSTSSSSSSSIRCPSSEDLSDRKGADAGESQATSNILITTAGEQVQQQQQKLRALIKVVKRLIRSQRV